MSRRIKNIDRQTGERLTAPRPVSPHIREPVPMPDSELEKAVEWFLLEWYTKGLPQLAAQDPRWLTGIAPEEKGVDLSRVLKIMPEPRPASSNRPEPIGGKRLTPEQREKLRELDRNIRENYSDMMAAVMNNPHLWPGTRNEQRPAVTASSNRPKKGKRTWSGAE